MHIYTLLAYLFLHSSLIIAEDNLSAKLLKEQEKLIQQNHSKQIEIEALKQTIKSTITREDILSYESSLNRQLEEYLSKDATKFEVYVPYEVDNSKKIISIDSCALDSDGKPSANPWKKPAILYQVSEKGSEVLNFQGTKKAIYPLDCEGPIERSLWSYKSTYIPAAIPLLTTIADVKYLPVPKDAFKDASFTPADIAEIKRINLILKMYPPTNECKIMKWENFIIKTCENSVSLFYNHRRIAQRSSDHIELVAILEISRRKYYFVAYTSNQGIDMDGDQAFELVPEFGMPIRPTSCSMPTLC